MLLSNFLHLFLESAPWLLLGLFLAGMLKMFVPMEWMQRQLGGHGFKATLKAAILGAPLPLCSCGVIPAAIGLRRAGASKAATTSFLVSTPETGVDSVTVSYVLLGPFMAIVRPIAAIISAIVAGLLVGRDEDDISGADAKLEKSSRNPSIKPETTAEAAPISKPALAAIKPGISLTPVAANAGLLLSQAPAQMANMQAAPLSLKPVGKGATNCCASKTLESKAVAKSDSCCASEVTQASGAVSCCSSKEPAQIAKTAESNCCAAIEPAQTAKTADSGCCSGTEIGQTASAVESGCCSNKAQADKVASLPARFWAGIVYAATDLVRDTTLWLLIGLFFAALVQTYVPADFLAQWGNGILAMLVMVLVSVPMYICATASTPIAAGLLLAGVSPGAVLVFMMAGPATNIATLGVVSKELGKRALFGYLGGVLGVALLAGILVNYLVATFGFEVAPQIGQEHSMLPDWLVASSGLLLALLMGRVLWQKLPKRQKANSCCSG